MNAIGHAICRTLALIYVLGVFSAGILNSYDIIDTAGFVWLLVWPFALAGFAGFAFFVFVVGLYGVVGIGDKEE